MTNVLFVGGGRRVSLARRFIRHDCKVFAYEIDNTAPINLCAEVIIGLKWSNENVKQDLLRVFDEYNIDLVIPLQDAATEVLSQMATDRTKIITSGADTNVTCLNKKKFERLFRDCEKISYMYPFADSAHSAVIKPIYGFGSRGIRFVESKSGKFPHSEEEVVQSRISGTEISVDAYFNKKAELVDLVPRERLVVQGGEVSKSITLSRDGLYETILSYTKAINNELRLVGPTCIQYIIDNKSLNPYIIEINARFGGGVILSLEAGLDMIDLLIREYIHDEEIRPQSSPAWKESFGMNRHFEEYFYNG